MQNLPASYVRDVMELTEIIRYFGALALVLALVGAAAVAMRKFGGPNLPGMKTRRLAVVESITLGGSRHRLFLVRCDAGEHLLVVGPQGATLVANTGAAVSAQTSSQGLSA